MKTNESQFVQHAQKMGEILAEIPCKNYELVPLKLSYENQFFFACEQCYGLMHLNGLVVYIRKLFRIIFNNCLFFDTAHMRSNPIYLYFSLVAGDFVLKLISSAIIFNNTYYSYSALPTKNRCTCLFFLRLSLSIHLTRQPTNHPSIQLKPFEIKQKRKLFYKWYISE